MLKMRLLLLFCMFLFSCRLIVGEEYEIEEELGQESGSGSVDTNGWY